MFAHKYIRHLELPTQIFLGVLLVFASIAGAKSVKHFSTSHQITERDIHQLLSATILSPTAFNIQNWSFVIILDPALRSQIRAHGWEQPQITDASLLIALCADLKAWDKSQECYWSHAPKNIQQMMVPSIDLYYRCKPQIQWDEALRSCGIAAQSLMLTA
ncbi:nitroreductase family protein [Citrobacter koseri]|uniref:nitroreductase family protein n=1 Tax=Citrobacter koseri TaxID=545 RepID=UPI003899FEF0